MGVFGPGLMVEAAAACKRWLSKEAALDQRRLSKEAACYRRRLSKGGSEYRRWLSKLQYVLQYFPVVMGLELRLWQLWRIRGIYIFFSTSRCLLIRAGQWRSFSPRMLVPGVSWISRAGREDEKQKKNDR